MQFFLWSKCLLSLGPILGGKNWDILGILPAKVVTAKVVNGACAAHAQCKYSPIGKIYGKCVVLFCVVLCCVVPCCVVPCSVVVWCGVAWRGVVWCGVVWCGVVWCGVVWCGVVWCGVPKALLPNGNGRDALDLGNAKREGCVSERGLPVVCCTLGTGQELSPCAASSVQGCPGDSLPLCLLVQLEFLQRPCHSAPWPRAGLNTPSVTPKSPAR